MMISCIIPWKVSKGRRIFLLLINDWYIHGYCRELSFTAACQKFERFHLEHQLSLATDPLGALSPIHGKDLSNDLRCRDLGVDTRKS